MSDNLSSTQSGADMLPPALVERVVSRLALPGRPRPDWDGLAALYAAWSRHVPFDNVRKCIALHEQDDRALPGTCASDFLEHWLTEGTGGTCWAGSGALFALLAALGFDVRRAAGSMRDLGSPNHGTVIAHTGGADWLVDSSMLVGAPLPLGPGLFRSDASFGVEIEATGRGHVVWFDTPPHRELFPCRLLEYHVDDAFFRDAYERSRASSPFNAALYARRNHEGRKIVLRGSTRFVRTAEGTSEEALDRDALCAALHEDIGISQRMVQRWADCGALDACYTPVVGPATAPLALLPPSRRAPTPSPTVSR